MKMAFSLFCKNLLLNLLIAAQLCASTVFGIISFAVISKAYFYYDVTSTIDDAFVYMPQYAGVYYEDSAISQYAQSGDICVSRSRSEYIWGYTKKFDDAKQSYVACEYKIDRVYSFGTEISEIMRSQLKKGDWFSNSAKDGVIECVIVGDEKQFPIDTIIDGAEFGFEYHGENDLVMIRKNEYKFLVVGYCGMEANCFEFSTVSKPAESMELSSAFKEVSYKKQGFFESLGARQEEHKNTTLPAVTIFCSTEAICNNALGDGDKNYSFDNAIFTFSDNVSPEKKSEIISELKKEAGVTDVNSLRKRELVSVKNNVAQYLPIMICFFSLTVVGVICVALLNMIKNRDVFKTYIICGISTKRGCAMLAIYTAILLIIAVILTLLAWTAICLLGIVPWTEMSFGSHTVLFALGNFLVSASLIMITSVSMLKKYQTSGVEI